MRHLTDFYFNGQYSKDLNLFNMTDEEGMLTEPLLSDLSINQELIKNNAKGYFLSKDRSPFSFQLNLGSHEKWTRERINMVSNWLDVDYFTEFYFIDEPTRRFFVMPNGTTQMIHDAMDNGYIKVEMQSNSPYSFSQLYSTGEVDFSIGGGTRNIINLANETTEVVSYVPVRNLAGYPENIIEFTNMGDFSVLPIIRLTKVEDGDITIFNETDEGKVFQLFGLYDQEEIYIDNENREILTDLKGIYRYKDHNGYWLKLIKGYNSLKIIGRLKVEFIFRFQYKSVFS
jgi:phage-related protein